MLLLTCLTLLLQPPTDLYRQQNLVAWCIVPFDAKQRGPAERVAMLQRLGIQRYAYDWRDKHLPSFEEEVQLLVKAGIQLQAVWFPPLINRDTQNILSILKRYKIVTELWVSLDDPKGSSDADKVSQAVSIIKPLLGPAKEAGCTICLYNHGGWMGQPKNLLAILKELPDSGVGLIYNLHHGHVHLDRFAEVLQQLQPALKCITLNGMVPQGDQQGKKILPIGAGTEDLKLLKLISDSGYRGPIAILGHMHEFDVEDRLKDNLDGLRWLQSQLAGQPAGNKPAYRTYRWVHVALRLI